MLSREFKLQIMPSPFSPPDADAKVSAAVVMPPRHVRIKNSRRRNQISKHLLLRQRAQPPA